MRNPVYPGQQSPWALDAFLRQFFFGYLPKKLNISRTAIKTDGHLSSFNDNGNLAFALGVLQHGVELVSI